MRSNPCHRPFHSVNITFWVLSKPSYAHPLHSEHEIPKRTRWTGMAIVFNPSVAYFKGIQLTPPQIGRLIIVFPPELERKLTASTNFRIIQRKVLGGPSDIL